MSSKEVIVSISLGGEDIRVGRLWFHVGKARESTSSVAEGFRLKEEQSSMDELAKTIRT